MKMICINDMYEITYSVNGSKDRNIVCAKVTDEDPASISILINDELPVTIKKSKIIKMEVIKYHQHPYAGEFNTKL